MALQWLTLVATIWLQSINGTNSNFPSYSSEFKRMLSISQLQLNNLASASDAGKFLGWISGVSAAYLPLWLVLVIGSLIGLVGYGVQFLFITNQITSLSYWHIFSLTVLAGNSICWINTVSNIVAIRSFPLDRQISVGLSTSYLGLSAKIYTVLVDAFVASSLSPDERAKLFLFLNSVVPLVVCVVAAPFVAAKDVSVRNTRKLTEGFFAMFAITIVTGVFAVFTSFGARFLFLPRYVVLVGMFVMLLLPLAVPIAEKIRETLEQKCLIRVHDNNEGFNTLASKVNNDNEKRDDDGDCDEEIIIRTVGVVEEIGAKMMLKKVDFWIYFFVYFFGATIGLVYMNNLAQIAESRGCSGTSSLVSLSSAFSFFGRLLPSLVDYYAPKSRHLVTRAGAMGVMMTPMCAAFLLLLNGYDVSLYISTAIIGLCTGAISSISVATTTELFGTKNFGVNHNILISNIPIGSFLFGGFAALLGKHVSNDENCMGEECYEITFIIWGCLCALGTLLAFILHARTRRFMYNNSSN